MNDRAARLLGVRDGFGGLDPEEGLASGLRTWVDGGIESRGEVVSWAPIPADADDAPGRLVDLYDWEHWHNDFHLEDFVSVDYTYADGPIVGVDAQRTLLRQGIALAREVGRLAGELSTPIPLRCIIKVDETNGKFAFYRIRPEDSWVLDDLDGDDRGYDPDTIRRRLELMPTCPEGLAWYWDQCDDDIGSWNSETDLQPYLRLLADRCRAVDTALIGVFTGADGLVLGFLPSDKLERFIVLAATAKAEIVIYGSVEPVEH